MIRTILTIAGSDSSGGAGIQADLKSIAANGGYGASVITAITAQNTRGVVRAEPVAIDLVLAQIDAVFDDLDVAAVKTGMLADGAVVATVGGALRDRRPDHYVCDPVMISKSGHALLAASAVAALVEELLPLATVVTPNVHEAEKLARMEVRTLADAAEAGRRIIAMGARAVLVKGGHLAERPATDTLVTATGVRLFAAEPESASHTHGTGCTYAAAIATWLGRGLTLEAAVGRAKEFITLAIRHGLEVGHGTGPTDPFFFLDHGDTSPASWGLEPTRNDGTRTAQGSNGGTGGK